MNFVKTHGSLECAGFLTIRAQFGENTPKGFNPSWDLCFESPEEMREYAEQTWNK